MRSPPSWVRSIASVQLYFFKNTRFSVPGASRMSNPGSRSQFTASSYVRGWGCLAIDSPYRRLDHRNLPAVAKEVKPILSHIQCTLTHLTPVLPHTLPPATPAHPST